MLNKHPWVNVDVCKFLYWNLSTYFYFWPFSYINGAATAGTNKAASSSTSLNTRKLDEETENLSRELHWKLNPNLDMIIMLCSFIYMLSSDDRVPLELKKNIMQARMDKKLTQAQLGQVNYKWTLSIMKFSCSLTFIFFWKQLINEKPQVIQEYESGKAIPNQQIIIKLERALGAKLRGKKW